MARAEIIDSVKALPEVQLRVVGTREDLAAHLTDAQGLIMGNPSEEEGEAIAQIMRTPNRLEWVHLISAGMDGVAFCKLPAEITVTHTPGATANAVGDHALALLLALMRRLPTAWNQQLARQWNRAPIAPKATSIEGKTVVLLGNGAIGNRTVNALLTPLYRCRQLRYLA